MEQALLRQNGIRFLVFSAASFRDPYIGEDIKERGITQAENLLHGGGGGCKMGA
jgi:hypothetical protein